MLTELPTRGYSTSKEQLRHRLHRVEGQIRGIERMVDEGRYCTDVITQISAVQAALDKVALGVLEGHARHSVAASRGEVGSGELIDELMAAVARLMRRG